MAALPGWNSLESVARIHAWLEITGIVVLALLLLSQGLAFTYGARKDVLQAVTENTDTVQLRKEMADSEARHKTKEAQLQQQVFQADTQLERKLASLQDPQLPRHLTAEQQATLVKALAPFKGQKITTTSVIGDEEGDVFARDFQSIFAQAGWDHGTHERVEHRFITPTPVGVMVAMNEGEANAGRIMPSVETLISVLQQLGITARGELLVNPQVPVGEINLIVGNRQAAPQTAP